MASTIPVKSAVLRTFEIEGRPSPPDGESSVQFLRAGPDYFRVVRRLRDIAGRDFNDGDHATSLPVAIVNESFAARFWPGEQPLGKRLRVDESEARSASGGPWSASSRTSCRETPFGSSSSRWSTCRSSRNRRRGARSSSCEPPCLQAAWPQAVRAAAQSVDPDVVLEDFDTLKASFAFDRDFMDAEHSELGKHAKVAPVFALIALLLAAIGLSAVIAHSVSQRTKEIGVRMAIGAARRTSAAWSSAKACGRWRSGMLVGLAASLAVNRILQSQLVGVSPYDPLTLAGAPVGADRGRAARLPDSSAARDGRRSSRCAET